MKKDNNDCLYVLGCFQKGNPDLISADQDDSWDSRAAGGRDRGVFSVSDWFDYKGNQSSFLPLRYFLFY